MKKEDVVEALKTLDPKKDAHWTGQGLPAVEVVESLLGESVTRAELTKVAPLFRRDNPSFAMTREEDDSWMSAKKEQEEKDAKDAQDTKDAAAAKVLKDAQDAATDKPDDEVTAGAAKPAVTGLDEILPEGEELTVEEQKAFVAKAIEEENETIREAKGHVERLKEVIKGAEKRIDDMYRARDAKFPPKTAGQATKEYIEKQYALRAQRAEARGKVKQILREHGAVGPDKSPIDMAIQSRNQKGVHRPQRAPVRQEG